MLKKLKYKLWKHLSKQLITDTLIRRAVLQAVAENNQKKISGVNEVVNHSPTHTTNKPAILTTELPVSSNAPKIVAIQGIYYSGSSALIGMFHEFDNIRVVGYSDSSWSVPGAKDKMLDSECLFFSSSGFIEMISAFHDAAPEVMDQKIRIFISKINNVIKNGGFSAFEKIPELYSDTFKIITRKFLLKILYLDEHTREYMQTRLFPTAAYENDDASYDSCNFMFGSGKKRYVFYRFADLTQEEFRCAVSEYLNHFFSILSGNEYIVYDQLLPRKSLEVVNEYLATPIKQIVIYRDPRDQYVSANRRGTDWMPRTPRGIKDHNIRRLQEFPANNQNRLIIRFEDIVLNYEKTKKRVMDFLGLKPENHIAPKSVFDPAISVANIGAWRQYHRQEFMQEIEKELGEYCFYPEKENLSIEAIRLLISSGNWDDKCGIKNK